MQDRNHIIYILLSGVYLYKTFNHCSYCMRIQENWCTDAAIDSQSNFNKHGCHKVIYSKHTTPKQIRRDIIKPEKEHELYTHKEMTWHVWVIIVTQKIVQNNLSPYVLVSEPSDTAEGHEHNWSVSVTVIGKVTWVPKEPSVAHCGCHVGSQVDVSSKTLECRGYQMAVATIFSPFTHLAE